MPRRALSHTLILIAVAFLPACNLLRSQFIPFDYSKDEFGDVSVRYVQRVDSSDESVVNKFPIDAPAHVCYDLESKRLLSALEKGSRYYHPAFSFVCIVPKSEMWASDFASAYPNFSQADEKLQVLLRTRPKNFHQFEDLFDFPYNNAGWSFVAKADYLDFENVSGVFFLTQYSNEAAPNPANNEELTANFQGRTSDGKYYVAARFAIAHPSLPKGIDFTDEGPRSDALTAGNIDVLRERVRSYLEKEKKKVEELNNDGFVPSIQAIKEVIATVSP